MRCPTARGADEEVATGDEAGEGLVLPGAVARYKVNWKLKVEGTCLPNNIKRRSAGPARADVKVIELD